MWVTLFTVDAGRQLSHHLPPPTVLVSAGHSLCCCREATLMSFTPTRSVSVGHSSHCVAVGRQLLSPIPTCSGGKCGSLCSPCCCREATLLSPIPTYSVSKCGSLLTAATGRQLSCHLALPTVSKYGSLFSLCWCREATLSSPNTPHPTPMVQVQVTLLTGLLQGGNSVVTYPYPQC